jgi:hypothetical protein
VRQVYSYDLKSYIDASSELRHIYGKQRNKMLSSRLNKSPTQICKALQYSEHISLAYTHIMSPVTKLKEFVFSH